jgi:hypothetical protein
MKKVFACKNKLISKWLEQTQNFGRNQSMSLYFENEIIYSYGNHYPIAIIIDNVALVNSSNYSRTTSTQRNNVIQALLNKKFLIFEVPVIKRGLSSEDHHKNNMFYCERIDEILLKQKKAISTKYTRILDKLLWSHKKYKQIFK